MRNISDRAKNFVGPSAELKNAVQALQFKELHFLFSLTGIHGDFKMINAPNYGGAWERRIFQT